MTDPDSMASFERQLKDTEATSALGAELALMARAGSVIRLHGELGAGKTTLARSFIQALAGEDIEVPSPTFTLVQTYDTLRVPVAHVDLYRLSAVEELDELGLDELLRTHQLIVEWPERLGPDLTADRLDIKLTTEGKGRKAELAGAGAWALALKRLGKKPALKPEDRVALKDAIAETDIQTFYGPIKFEKDKPCSIVRKRLLDDGRN